MTLVLDDLARLEALERAATPADAPLPWRVLRNPRGIACSILAGDRGVLAMPAALEYLVAAANALPALLADHARLVAEVADLRDDIAAGEQGRAYLRTLIEEAQRGQRKAEAEVARLRALVEDACHHLDALGQTGKSWAKSFRAELAGE